MKKVILCFREQYNKSYVGGILSIMRSYLTNRSDFENNGICLGTFFYELGPAWDHVGSKIRNTVYIFQQRKALRRLLHEDRNVVLNIHTSREFMFLKDVVLAVLAEKKFGVPSVITIHVGDISTVFNRIAFAKPMLLKWLNLYIDKIVFLSDEMRKQFVAEGVDSSKCEVLYNFHNMETIAEEEKLPRTAKLHLIYVGAIHREKGVLELLDALCNMDDLDFHLDLCGQLTDRSIEEEFNQMVEKLENKITLCGYVSGKQKTALFDRADILLLPSYHEGMPLVILEGISQGCALISTKVGATPEILDEENVIWIKVKDATSIESAIRALNASPNLLNEMKQKNEKLSTAYSLEDHIAKLCNIYKAL